MLLNEIQAFFGSLCFFALTFFKSNLITFCFSLSLTWRHTNYETIKFLRLCLQNSNRNEKVNKYVKHLKQPLRCFLQSRFYDTLTLKQMLQNYQWTSWFFREELVLTSNFTIAELFLRKFSNICVSNILREVNNITTQVRQTKMWNKNDKCK